VAAGEQGASAAVRPAFRVAISLGLMAAFLALFLLSFDFAAAWRSLGTASPTLVLLSVAINLVGFLVRAWRWRYLMAPIREGVGMYNLTSTTFIGFMVSFLVPFRLGEVVRPILLARRERVSPSATLATIALERLLDTLTVMTLFLVFILSARGAALLSAAPGEAASQASLLLRRGALGAGALVLVAVPLVVILVAFPGRVVAILHRLHGGRSSWATRAIEVVERFITGLGAVRRGRDLAASLLLSVALWLLIDLSVFVGTSAFGLPLRLPDIFLLILPLAVGIAMPTPGGVGPYEFLAQISLTDFWGIPRAVAAAAAIALHAIALVPTIAIGLAFMWRDGLRPADVKRLASFADVSTGREGTP
jgi:glycosyltransferase 2 family protein